MKMLSDNLVAISIAKNLIYHDKTKHLLIDRHFIIEKVKPDIVELVHIPAWSKVTNILTKAYLE